jgi:beta-mannosidase
MKGTAGMISLPLADNWTVEPDGPAPEFGRREPVPAHVPESVHESLERAGIIPDPLVGSNEARVRWVSETDWRYRTDFDIDPDAHLGSERIDLVFDGVDTIGSIALNGVPIGHTANQHRSYRFDVTELLRSGRNSLEVLLESPVRAALAEQQRLGARPHLFDDPFNMIRKSAANFGWDWGPSLPTVALWRPVRLEMWSTARLGRVSTQTRSSGSAGTLLVRAEVERAAETGDTDAGLAVLVDVAGERHRFAVEPGASVLQAEIRVEQVDAWWPRSHGDQPLYPLRVELVSEASADLGASTSRVGFRTVAIESAPDAHGVGFRLMVNERAIAVRGANWIPASILTPSRPAAEYRRLLQDAADAGMNLVRVWGGGVYEDDSFYDACDELGLLVWQDFLFACAAYPEEEPFAGEIAAEAEEAVLRLARHASIALWCGNNENLWLQQREAWPAQLDGLSWGEGYYRELLPRTVAAFAPETPYVPGSPFSAVDVDENAPGDGLMHSWEVWNQLDYESYADDRPRFVSEFGFQSAPSWSAMRRAMGDEPLEVESAAWLGHQKAENGAHKMSRSLRAHLGEPQDVERWQWATQLNQAHALEFGIDWFRSLGALNTGMIIWQLNDCWGGMSWSLVDVEGNRKPAWHAVRRAYGDLACGIVTVDGAATGFLVNETDAAATTAVTVRRMGLGGDERARERHALTVPARSSLRFAISAEVSTADDPRQEVLAIALDDGRALARMHYLVPNLDLALPEPAFSTLLAPVEGGYSLTITAQSFLRDLWIQADRLPGATRAEQDLVSLLPGESTTIRLQTTAVLTDDLFTGFPVVSTANDLTADRETVSAFIGKGMQDV